MIALLVMTDGRGHLLDRTLAAFTANVSGPISELWIHDDSGDPAYRARLDELYGDFGFRIVSTPGRSGFGGAIRSAWSALRIGSDARFVFHLEDDFVFRRPVDLTRLAHVLDRDRYLAQLAFRRQPWNDHERAAGGIVEQHPDAYLEVLDELGNEWLEHRLFFTTNPSLYRRDLVLEREWPTGSQSEGRFSHELLGDAELRFAYWGSRDSGEWVEHIGEHRVGTGY
jgi:hypothetical protein